VGHENREQLMIPSGVVPPNMPDYAMSFGGLIFGAWSGSPYGQPYQLGPGGIQGLDLPAVASGDIKRPRTHGELVGLDLLGGRDITVDLIVGQTQSTSIQANLRALANALAIGGSVEQALWIQMPDATYGVMARVRKRAFNIDQSYMTAGATVYSVMFHCTDPRIYSTPTELATLTDVGPAAVDLKFPLSFPAHFAVQVAPSAVTIANNGNLNCYPQFVLTGPLTNPALTLAAGGQPTLAFVNPAQGTGFTLNTGDQLVIDSQSQACLLFMAGSATALDVRSWVQPGSLWWSLLPGNNDITFTSDDAPGTPTGTCTIQYASAFDSL
jgi:Siphovirus-type tail component, C-terminal domain